MTFPYENIRGFIQAKADIQSRFLQAFPGNRPNQVEQGRLEACCRKLRAMAELHRGYLKFQSLTEGERSECLREKIREEWEALSRQPGQNYPELRESHDCLVREMVDTETDAKSIERIEPQEWLRGDRRLLQNQRAVNFTKAEVYLGISPRGRQKAIKNGKLVVVGEGRNKMITVESLMQYLTPSN